MILPSRESEGAVGARKRGNACRAKGPCRIHVFIRCEEIRLDTRPTTEEHGGLSWDEQPAEPEKKSGVKLPPKVSELRWKLGQKAKQEPKFRREHSKRIGSSEWGFSPFERCKPLPNPFVLDGLSQNGLPIPHRFCVNRRGHGRPCVTVELGSRLVGL